MLSMVVDEKNCYFFAYTVVLASRIRDKFQPLIKLCSFVMFKRV